MPSSVNVCRLTFFFFFNPASGTSNRVWQQSATARSSVLKLVAHDVLGARFFQRGSSVGILRSLLKKYPARFQLRKREKELRVANQRQLQRGELSPSPFRRGSSFPRSSRSAGGRGDAAGAPGGHRHLPGGCCRHRGPAAGRGPPRAGGNRRGPGAGLR